MAPILRRIVDASLRLIVNVLRAAPFIAHARRSALSGAAILAVSAAVTLVGKAGEAENADYAWARIVAARDGLFSGQANGESKQVTQGASSALTVADMARDYGRLYAVDKRAAQARRVEIESLLFAAKIGSRETLGRLDAATEAFKQDLGIPEGDRAEVSALVGFGLAVSSQNPLSARMASVADVARKLRREFPGQPQGHESLFNVARYVDDAEYERILRELDDPATPPELRRSAVAGITRQTLKGKRLDDVLAAKELRAPVQALQKNRPTLVYTWSARGGNRIASMLKSRALAGINVLAVCVDPDSPSTRRFAGGSGFPGTRYFDTALFCSRYGLVHPDEVILADATGVIIDARGEFKLSEKIAQWGI